PPLRGLLGKHRGDRRLAGAGRPLDQRARAALDAAAEQRVERGEATAQGRAIRLLTMLGGDQPRVHFEPAAADRVVVIAAPEIAASELRDAQASARNA